MLPCKIFKCTDKDIKEGHVGWDTMIIGITAIVIGLCLVIWKITIPIAVITGGAYYARYYMRQKRKSLEKETE